MAGATAVLRDPISPGKGRTEKKDNKKDILYNAPHAA